MVESLKHVVMGLNHAISSVSFNYHQFLEKDNYEKNLKFEGDVYQEQGLLQLTRNGPDSAGRVTFNKHLQLWDTNTKKLADFTTHFSFIINSSDSNHLGDGITFFLAHPNFSLPVPPDGSGIGLVGRREMADPNYPEEHPFVAVEFDAFPNEDLGDPPYDHVGIDVKKMWTPYTTQWYNVKDGKKVYDAEITYNSSSHMLNVAFTGYKNDTKIQQEYSHEIDLRDFLPSQVQFGISSSTGLIFETHTLCSWSFNSSGIALLEENKDKSKSEIKSKSKKKMVIWVSMIGSIVLICGLCSVWLMIWKMKSKKKKYEFDHNSLDNDFERSTGPKRYVIAQGLASAILYLHEEWDQCVVHRDLKSSNVMLDTNFNAKLGDFGLARLVEHDKGSSETTVIAGTKGYMAPECATISKATKESDVYSFGVVALELACGRKPIVVMASQEELIMVERVWELYGMGKVLEASDPRLCGEFEEEKMERLMIVGLWCAHPDYVLRPTIRQVVSVLNLEGSLPSLPPKMPKPTYVVPSFSEIGASSSSFFSPNNAKSFGINQSQASYSGSSQTNMSDTVLLPR
ncbi:L-type lectin-domain containing receptor kinase IX.1-like [Senna tora]|uniref:L-type lectin-domain containing receptor kinase IX.1-like n=1 Tax=Senna tora TaxID=362788 RepID=A0A834XEX1_9FABA|nr:L-type lectin-domain containing receptor kinase IX.1-like [Senna tora]